MQRIRSKLLHVGLAFHVFPSNLKVRDTWSVIETISPVVPSNRCTIDSLVAVKSVPEMLSSTKKATCFRRQLVCQLVIFKMQNLWQRWKCWIFCIQRCTRVHENWRSGTLSPCHILQERERCYLCNNKTLAETHRKTLAGGYRRQSRRERRLSVPPNYWDDLY